MASLNMPEADQIEWPQDEVLFELAWRAVSEGLLGNGIVTAGDLKVTATVNTREISVAAGTAWYAGSDNALGSASTHTLSQGDGSNDRYDTVAFDTSTNSVNIREGTAAANPEPPDIASDELLLAWVYVPQNFDSTFSDSTHIFNWRGHASQAANIKYDDTAWTPTAATIKAALDELQEAAQISAYPLAIGDLANPFGLDELTDMDVDGTDLTDGATVLYEQANGFFRNEVVQALANLTSDEQFSVYPLVIGTDVAAHLGGNDLLDASAGSTIYDTSAGHVVRSQLDQNRVIASVSSNTTTSGEEIIFVDSSGSAITITIASADIEAGNHIIIVDSGGSADTNNITIATEGAENIDGGSTITIDTAHGAQVLAAEDGSNLYTAGGGSGGGIDQTEIFEGRESGTVTAGNQGILTVDALANNATVEVYKAALVSADGTAVGSNVTLKLVTLDNSGGFTSQATLITGDGATVFDRETGSPLGTHTNASGSEQTIAVLVDNQETVNVDIMAVVEGQTNV